MTAVQHEPAQLGSGRPGPSPDPANPAGSSAGTAFPEPRHRTPPGRRGGNRAGDPGGSTIGRRVARILALPAAVILLLLGILSAQQIGSYRDAAATADAVTLSLEVQKLVSALQTERGVTAAVQGGNSSFTPELAPARSQVDSQRRVVQGLVGNSDGDRARVDSALSQLDGLTAIRASTDAGKNTDSAGRTATFEYYTERIAGLADVDLGLGNSGDTQLRRGLTAFRSLQHGIEGLSQERAFLNGVYSAGGFSGDEFVRLADMRAEYQYSLDQFGEYATAGQKQSLSFIFSTGAAQVVQSFEQTALEAGDGRHLNVNPQSWWSGMGTLLADANQLEQHVGSQIQERAHDLQQAAAGRIGLLLVAVVVCFAGSVYLSTLAALSISRPLASLAAEADDLAVNRLPEAVRRAQNADPDSPPQRPETVRVPDRATDEIRSVATALDHLQTAAYELATEQALQRRDTIQSLANLGRRNQNLIRRQLGFITSLEREEVDPNALANLFELDHLATRMRRNASSLLVLVDASSPRTWSQAVPVADVIRAAVSEVEEYRRVALRRVDEANVLGSAIGSIAHLLSELIENGLTFSPPDSEVEVQGRRIADGYLIAVTDQGVGMTPEELRVANSRLRGEGDFIAAPTRFLGHFVVGKLARDTGVQVELLPSPVTGVTARVILPASLLAASLSVEVRSLQEPPVVQHYDQPAPLLALPRLDPLDDPLHDIPRVPDDPGELVDDAQISEIGGVPGPRAQDLPVIEPVIDRFDERGFAPEISRAPAHRDDDPAFDEKAFDDQGLTADLPVPGHVAGTPRWAKPGDLVAHQFEQRTHEGPGADDEDRGGPGSRPANGNFIDLRTPAAGLGLPAAKPAPGTPPSGTRPTGSLRPAQARTPGMPRRVSPPGSPQTAGIPLAGGAGPVDHTQNGLRKRVPRSQRQDGGGPARTPRRVIDLDAAAERSRRGRPGLADSPADVSARLTALRAGMRRGQGGQGDRPGTTGTVTNTSSRPTSEES
ncbi:nitrate- and nitrite sensing domain-containing protein [Kineosporia mesophila]|uniref:histidine kinase n=1 Tax=Kineosporia mesophila TaxID=566012 RepID=A0ABP6ZJX4_9ACTN|nr:nitrate- and nitrite sensing domain-containing protein [Kineosporia mesophila]MCD5349551.1 nitrate- and nitrite sensing domain-containing protein [Kineosporia mesophila]